MEHKPIGLLFYQIGRKSQVSGSSSAGLTFPIELHMIHMKIRDPWISKHV